MKKEKMKGITLIALIVTIIVLLILAGVTVVTLTGENGLLNRAKTAAEETKKAEALEEIKLKIIEVQTEKQGNATLEDLVECLKNDTTAEYKVTKVSSKTSNLVEGSIGVSDVGDIEKIYITNVKYGYEIEVYKNLTVSEKVVSNGETNKSTPQDDDINSVINKNSSEVITKLECNAVQNNNKINVTITSEFAEGKNAADIYEYILIVNGKVTKQSSNTTITIDDVLSDTTYKIGLICIDKDAGVIIDKEITEITTSNITPGPLELPTLTGTGVVNYLNEKGLKILNKSINATANDSVKIDGYNGDTSNYVQGAGTVYMLVDDSAVGHKYKLFWQKWSSYNNAATMQIIGESNEQIGSTYEATSISGWNQTEITIPEGAKKLKFALPGQAALADVRFIQ